MASTGLSSLALELVQHIASFVVSPKAVRGFEPFDTSDLIRPSDLHSLRLVCRLFKFAVDPHLFSVISLDFTFPHSVLQHQISTLNDTTVSPSQYCRGLQIKKRSPNYELASSMAYYEHLIPDPGDPIVGLVSAIKSLQNLKVVFWHITTDRSIEPIVDALTQLPQVEEFRLDTVGCNGPEYPSTPSLRRLSHFRHISLLCNWDSEDFIQPLAEVIGKSPLLSRLEFDNLSSTNLHPGSCLFHTLVQNVPNDTPLQLDHLSFIWCQVNFDNSTFPHLKFLSSIHITWSVESQYDHLWPALGAATTWLKEITVDKISQNLLDYLTLYSGLVKLGLHLNGDLDQRRGVDQLYNISLSRHKYSLSTLGVVTFSSGVLCITPREMCSIVLLKELRWLSLSLSFDADDFDDGINAAKQVIMTAFNLPLLRGLDLGLYTTLYTSRAVEDMMAEMILSADISHLDQSWKYFHLRVAFRDFNITISDDGCMRFTDGHTIATRDV